MIAGVPERNRMASFLLHKDHLPVLNEVLRLEPVDVDARSNRAAVEPAGVAARANSASTTVATLWPSRLKILRVTRPASATLKRISVEG